MAWLACFWCWVCLLLRLGLFVLVYDFAVLAAGIDIIALGVVSDGVLILAYDQACILRIFGFSFFWLRINQV